MYAQNLYTDRERGIARNALGLRAKISIGITLFSQKFEALFRATADSEE